MSRYECPRCGEVCFTTNPPHLCADLKRRLERQTKAVAIVREILDEHFAFVEMPDYGEAALDIVKALSGRDLGV